MGQHEPHSSRECDRYCCTCRPLHFRNACLAPVFVVIIIAALAQDQHVGTRIQVTALLLGPAWLAVLLAIATVSSSRLRRRACIYCSQGLQI
jgi:hypothetical protein